MRVIQRDSAEKVTLIFAWLSETALVSMVLVTVLGVLMRYVFGAPILGVNEITQALSVALVMLALPYATATDAHVRVDLLDKPLGQIGRWIGEFIAILIGLAMMYFLIDRSWHKMLDAVEFGDTTNMLQLPQSAFFGLILSGSVLTCATMLFQFSMLFVYKSPLHE